MPNPILETSGRNYTRPTTINGKYAVGDTKTHRNGNITLTKDQIDEWEIGFDKIDIAPKDGKLSLNEICDERDREIVSMNFHRLFSFDAVIRPKKWLDDGWEMKAEIRKTQRYRNTEHN